jgi:hypothetical protein
MEAAKRPDKTHRKPRSGWTFENDPPIPRHEIPPERFHRETEPADPACPAWDEPGYVDPDCSHFDLPLAARYWQGFAKRCSPREKKKEQERAMSPEWVARVTEPGMHQAREEEGDPNWERVVRIKERDRESS